MKKEIVLTNDVKNNDDQVIAKLEVYLNGDGSTPNVMMSSGRVIGYDDDGRQIVEKPDNEMIKKAQQKFMAEAIKEQKALCVENGVDPDLVNIFDAEKRQNTEEEKNG